MIFLAPNKTDPKKDDKKKTDCETFAAVLAAAATAPLGDHQAWRARSTLGAVMLAGSYLHGTSWDGHPKERHVVSGFKPQLTNGGQDSDVYHHVGGHAGAMLYGGIEEAAISAYREINDWYQLWDDPGKRPETVAELLGNEAGRDVGFLMRDTIR